MRPLRLFSYLAAALPVVSVSLPEVAPFAPMVRVADGSEATVRAIAAAFGADSIAARRARRAAAEAESWEDRARTFLDAVGLGSARDEALAFAHTNGNGAGRPPAGCRPEEEIDAVPGGGPDSGVVRAA